MLLRQVFFAWVQAGALVPDEQERLECLILHVHCDFKRVCRRFAVGSEAR
jgi:hypothetical protein